MNEEIVFIDAGVPDIEAFRAGLRPGIDAVALGAERPALVQMADTLKYRRDVTAIHVVAHGEPGKIQFSSGILSLATADGHLGDLATIGRALAHDGEIRLWVCEAAHGPHGAAFMTGLAELTGARIRGSSHRVGASDRSGRWQLDRVADDRPATGGALPPLTLQAVAEYRGVLAVPTLTITDSLIDSSEVTAVPFTVTSVLGGTAVFIDSHTGFTVQVPVNSSTTSYTVDLSGMSRNVVSSMSGVSPGAPPVPFSVSGNSTIVATDPNLVLSVSEFDTIPLSQWQSNPDYTSVTIRDLRATFAALDGTAIANMLAQGVTAIGSSSGPLALTVDQYLNLGTMGVIAPAKIVDTAAAIEAMTAVEFSGLIGKNIKILQYSDSPLTLSLDQYNNLDGVFLPTNHSTTLSDDGTAISALATGGLYSSGIAALIGTSAVKFSVAQDLALGRVTVSAVTGGVTLSDTGAAITGLSKKQLAALATSGFTAIDSSDDTLALTAAQFQALGPVVLASDDTVTLKDSWANISALDLSTLATRGVDVINITNGFFAITATQYNDLGSVGIVGSAVGTLTGNGSDIAGLDPSGFAGHRIARIDASDNTLTLSLSEHAALDAITLTGNDVVTLADSGNASTGLASLSTGAIAALAGSGIDRIDATDNLLPLSVAQFRALGAVIVAPTDALTVMGTDGVNDSISFARQTFTTNDSFVGGTGTDTLTLSGDYSAGLAFGALGLVGIERLKVSGGHSYNLTTADANVAAGQTLTVNGGDLGALDSLVFNGSAETDGRFSVKGGAGADTFTGGSGNDSITGGAGADLLSGGGGADTFVYSAPSQSTSTRHDTVTDFNAGEDRFDFDRTVSQMQAFSGTVNSGGSFDTDLLFLLNDAIHSQSAVVVSVNGGDLAGHSLLVVGASSWYQAGSDYVVDITGFSGTLTTANFN